MSNAFHAILKQMNRTDLDLFIEDNYDALLLKEYTEAEIKTWTDTEMIDYVFTATSMRVFWEYAIDNWPEEDWKLLSEQGLLQKDLGYKHKNKKHGHSKYKNIKLEDQDIVWM